MNSGTVTIYLGKGPHYLLQKQDLFFPLKIDTHLYEVDITLK